MGNEEIREEEEEEVIEVVSEDDEDSDTPVSSGVDIIGDRPVRRAAQQAPPGCLYSFLLCLIGFGVGWMGCFVFGTMNDNAADLEQQAVVGVGAGQIREVADRDMVTAVDDVVKKNYGDACASLLRVHELRSIARNIDGKAAGASTLEGVIEKLQSDDPEAIKQGITELTDIVPDELKEKLVPAEEATEEATEGDEATEEGTEGDEATEEEAAVEPTADDDEGETHEGDEATEEEEAPHADDADTTDDAGTQEAPEG